MSTGGEGGQWVWLTTLCHHQPWVELLKRVIFASVVTSVGNNVIFDTTARYENSKWPFAEYYVQPCTERMKGLQQQFFFPWLDNPNGASPPHCWSIYISHSDTPKSVGLLWSRDRPVAGTSSWRHTTITADRHPCFSSDGIQTRNVTNERPQTHDFDCAATGIGYRKI
jgi:hypothetical protein